MLFCSVNWSCVCRVQDVSSWSYAQIFITSFYSSNNFLQGKNNRIQSSKGEKIKIVLLQFSIFFCFLPIFLHSVMQSERLLSITDTLPNSKPSWIIKCRLLLVEVLLMILRQRVSYLSLVSFSKLFTKKSSNDCVIKCFCSDNCQIKSAWYVVYCYSNTGEDEVSQKLTL